MNESSQAVYENRIARLERSLRRMRWGQLGLLCSVLALGLVWYGVTGIVQRQVVARRIVMVDDMGTIRVRIGQDSKDTRRISRAASVTIYDNTGTERGGMGTMANGRVAFGLDAPYAVAGDKVSDRAGMMVDGKGHATFAIMDNAGTPVVLMQSADKNGTMKVIAASPDGKQMDVRTLGVTGDTQSTEGAN